MKKIKLLIIILSSFLVCGCTSDIVIDINKDSINEVLTFEGNTLTDFYYMDYQNTFETELEYDKQEIDGVYKYNKSFTSSNYSKDSVIKRCFNIFKYEYNEENQNSDIEMKSFDCPELLDQISEIKLVIRTDGQIISSNIESESVNEIVYTITQENYEEAEIDLLISYGEEQKESDADGGNDNDPDREKREKEEKKEEEAKQTIMLASIVGGFILVMIVAVTIYAAKTNKKR